MARRPKLNPSHELALDPTINDILRFMKNIREDGECWMWTGRTDDNGYGRFDYAGTNVGAHRFSYALFKSLIPKSKVVHHDTCRNHSCVNPRHLWCVSKLENDTHAGNIQHSEPHLFRKTK